MARLISVSDDVYKNLKRLKGQQSFSKVIISLLSKKTNKEKILDFFGKGGIDPTKVKELSSEWNKWSERYA